MDRAAQFALAAANLALDDAEPQDHFNDDEHERTGVIMGLALACLEEGERHWTIMTDKGSHPPQLSPQEQLPTTLLMSHTAASGIAAHHQLHGPCLVVATGCSAGSDAIGQAFWTIQEQRADLMLAGGTDAAISYGVMDAFCVIGALSTHYNEEPTRASRPYDRARDGFVMAEGSGILLLEEREHALARGAHIYAEILRLRIQQQRLSHDFSAARWSAATTFTHTDTQRGTDIATAD